MKAQCSTKQFPTSVITHVYQIIFKVPPAGAGLQLLSALLQCIIIIIMGCSAEVLGTLDMTQSRDIKNKSPAADASEVLQKSWGNFSEMLGTAFLLRSLKN